MFYVYISVDLSKKNKGPKCLKTINFNEIIAVINIIVLNVLLLWRSTIQYQKKTTYRNETKTRINRVHYLFIYLNYNYVVEHSFFFFFILILGHYNTWTNVTTTTKKETQILKHCVYSVNAFFSCPLSWLGPF